jgi:hypothetical protein
VKTKICDPGKKFGSIAGKIPPLSLGKHMPLSPTEIKNRKIKRHTTNIVIVFLLKKFG